MWIIFQDICCLQMYRHYPELLDTDLSTRIKNDLTFNVKNNSIISDSAVAGRFLVSDKETQTDHSDSDTESNNLVIHDSVDPDTVSQNSVVKFNFEAMPGVASPVRSPMRSPIRSPMSPMNNGHTNKTILKKQVQSGKEISSSHSVERSHSLTDQNNREMSPLINQNFQSNARNQTEDVGGVLRLARFRERFAGSKKSSSIDVCPAHAQAPRGLALDIPEIVLNSPEEDSNLIV